LKGHRSAVTAVRFSPDNRWLISAGLDGAIKIWDLNKTNTFETLTSQSAIEHLIVNPQSVTVTSLHTNRKIMTWDLNTYESISRIKAKAPCKVVLEPVLGRHLFSFYDSSFDLYDIEAGTLIDQGEAEWSGVQEVMINEREEKANILCLKNGQKCMWSLDMNSVTFEFEERVNALENMDTDGPTKFVKLRRESREFL
jgi:WD40 repeat protein